MRFLGRRLLFYLLAFFVAVTLNFALPRLMPGSPLDGLILRYGTRFGATRRCWNS